MKQHDYSYDYLRAFATVMIVFCHIFTGFGVSVEIGYYLGSTYVDVFLLLSAYLLGLSSRNNVKDHPWNFLKKRTGRVIPTYYTYLTITFLLIVLFIGVDNLSGKQLVSHYLFLNWLWPSSRVANYPLPQLGHLWFMSCIILGYLSVVVWSQVIRRVPKMDTDKAWLMFFAFWSIAATLVTMRVRIAIYPFTIVLGFMLLFFRGREIISFIQKLRPIALISVLIICNSGGGIYYLLGGYDYPAIVFWINLLNAYLWIASAPAIFSRDKIPGVVSFLSAISFEIYLVHHPFCLGAYSLAQYMPIWLAIVCVFVIAIAGGWILSVITRALLNIQKLTTSQ